jgi:hypothetical protein
MKSKNYEDIIIIIIIIIISATCANKNVSSKTVGLRGGGSR